MTCNIPQCRGYALPLPHTLCDQAEERICSLCGHPVRAGLWRDPFPGGHVVVTDSGLRIGLDPTAAPDGDSIVIIAEQDVAFILCRQAVERENSGWFPTQPVKLCGELDTSKPYWVGDTRIDPDERVSLTIRRPWWMRLPHWLWVPVRRWFT